MVSRFVTARLTRVSQWGSGTVPRMLERAEMEDTEIVAAWGIRWEGYPMIVWAPDKETAISHAIEWLDYAQHVGQPVGEQGRPDAEQLGAARPWSEVAPLWETSEPTAWEAARERATRMRTLLGVMSWWLAIHANGD
jgi:hypothetical protein